MQHEGLKELQEGLSLAQTNTHQAMHALVKAAFLGNAQAQSLITYCSNALVAKEINHPFHALEGEQQRLIVQEFVTNTVSPLLARDGGGIVLVDYITGEIPQIWLKYTGHCVGCGLATTTTAGMILGLFEEKIDKKIAILLW